MNLNDGEEAAAEDLFFTQHCLELAKLLRTDQTDAFLQLYDSLPAEWTGSRLEAAKEAVRQYQEVDESDFHTLYQRAFSLEQTMSHPSLAAEQHDEQKHRITSLALLQQKQYQERRQANNLACDEKHTLSPKKTTEEVKNNNRRLQSGANSTSHLRTQHTPVDAFVQLNLTPDISIKLEDYKKAKDTMPATKNSSPSNQPSNPPVCGAADFNPQNANKKHPRDHASQDASFERASPKFDDLHSRSSSSSSSPTNQKSDLVLAPKLTPSNYSKHGKLIENQDFDSHGSSIETKSTSENSGSVRTGSGSDSEEGEKQPLLSQSKTTRYVKESTDDTLTVVLNRTSDHPTSQHNLKLALPEQTSYELVKSPTLPDQPSLPQLPRFKQPANDGSNGLHPFNNNLLPTTTPSSQSINSSSLSSSQQTQNSEHHEQNHIDHSNSSRKSATRATKKRKQPQQDVIRTELIPGHRGDLDVDELVMFIDGDSSNKQRQNSSSVRAIESNSNSNSSSSRRKSRKSSKIPQDNENKSSTNEHDDLHFLDHDPPSSTAVRTHSLTEPNPLAGAADDDESHSNTTNGETSLPEWHNTSSINDELDSLSLSSTTLNNSNSEITSEPFVTVTHRRRPIKERRPENNNTNHHLLNRTSRFAEKKRFQQPIRSTIPNSKSTLPSIPTTEEEQQQQQPPPPLPPPPPPPPSEASASIPDQTSPRLSSHSSSSSLSSLLKRQSKPAPAVVFLNKSVDVELNDVSFGFDMDHSNAEKPATPTPASPPSPPPTSSEASLEKDNHLPASPPSSSSSSTKRSYPQRNFRTAGFYSGTDIRLHQQRNYSSQSSYIDPYLLVQYNQQLAYINYLRTQYPHSQSSYVLIPTLPPTSHESSNTEQKESTSEQIQQPLFVCTALPGPSQPMPYPTNKKSFPSAYPSQYFYPTSHPAYFQPISTSSLVDNKSQHDDTDHDDLEDEEGGGAEDYEKSTRVFHQTHHSSSAHIMSNALQLVYSQEKLNSQTDRFNLDQLTAYLAMKWTETVDHYEQGDDEILLASE